jgi:hypothetical protein
MQCSFINPVNVGWGNSNLQIKKTKRKNQETTDRHWECKQKDSTILFSTDM